MFRAVSESVSEARIWLAAPATVSRWLLLLIVAAIALLMRVARRQGRALENIARMFYADVNMRHASPLPEPPREPEPEKVADGYTPTPGQLTLLYQAGRYGLGVSYEDAVRALKRIDPTATWDDARLAVTDLQAAGAVRYLGDYPASGYVMTQAGHRFLEALKESKRI